MIDLTNQKATIEVSDASNTIELNVAWIVQEGASVGDAVNSVNGQDGDVVLSAADVGAAPLIHTQAIGTITGLEAALSDLSDADSTLAGQIVAINNTLPLKADLVNGVVPTAQIPSIAITELLKLPSNMFPASEAEMLTLRGQQGDFTIRTDQSTQYTIVNGDGSQIGNWLAMPQGSSPVTSVNGQIGNVVLGRSDIGINSSDNVPEGVSNLYYTDQRVRNAPLTGLSVTTATPIVATDSVLSGLGKLQAQVVKNTIRTKIPAVSGRFYTNLNFGGSFTSGTVAALQRRTIIYEPLSDMQIDQVGIVLAATAATAGSALLAVYKFDSVNPSQLNLLQAFPEIAVDTTAGAKMVSTDYTFLVGHTYVFVLHVNQAFSLRTVAQTTQLAIGMTAADGLQNTFWFTSTSYTPTAPTTINLNTMTLTGSASVVVVMRAA